MGELKRRRRVKAAVTGLVLGGLLVLGIFVTDTAGKTINLKKHETSKQSQEVFQSNKDLLKKKLGGNQPKKASAKEISQPNKTVPVSPPANPAPEQAVSDQPEQPPAPASVPAPAPAPAQPVGTQVEDTSKTIYLTFDDGPSAISGEIIALLEQYKYKATFFMIDGNIRRFPDAVKLMVTSGEAVGLHSVSHRKDTFYASAASVIGELNQNRNTLLEIAGVDSHLARTPYGSSPYMTDEYKAAVKENSYILWDWNIDSKDWYYKDERYIQSVIDQINNMAGHRGPLVILMHEKRETLAHLPKLLDYLQSQGYQCKAINSTVAPVQF
ncbi:polysaccharide deacetylase family protein [Neobacillus dielmonensis]|uniref:polysaccharide deacetylase family protein n=1 Tax=Neobacillus dielmonensis TaxID=1347369 RepID=UPI0006948041|nr:polysaccharide deacetylase family protein [Neobacillus dielmonensis]